MHKRASTLTLWMIVTLFSVGASAAQDPAKPARTGRRSILTTERINLRGALQKIGYELFHPPKGSVLTITKVHDHWRTHEGVTFEKYEVSLGGRGVIGTFLRMRSFPGGESTVDLAIQLEHGRIVAAKAIQPVIIRGTPFLRLPELLLGLKEHEVSSYAEGLSRILQSLVYLEQAATGDDVGALSKEQTLVLQEWSKKNGSALGQGVSMPEFSTRDETGAPFGPARFGGKRSLVFLGTIHDDRAREALAWLNRYIMEHPDRFSVAFVVTDRKPTIDQYRNLGGRFAGTVVLDFELVVYKALGCTFTPAIYAFDGEKRLIKLLEPVMLTGYEKLSQELDAIK